MLGDQRREQHADGVDMSDKENSKPTRQCIRVPVFNGLAAP